MVTDIVTEQRNQASKIAAVDELVSLPLYASAGHDVMARALELTKVFPPAELQGSVDAILDANAMRGSEWCVSAKEQVA